MAYLLLALSVLLSTGRNLLSKNLSSVEFKTKPFFLCQGVLFLFGALALVSFEGMNETEIVIMNAALGSAVCVIVVLLGINLLRSKKALFKTLNN